MADEDVTLSVSLRDDITAGLRRIEQQVESLDREVTEAGASTEVAGDRMAAGFDRAGTASERAGAQARDAAGRFTRAGEEADRAGQRSRKGAEGLNLLGGAAGRARRPLSGLRSILRLFKWPVLITGAVAFAGALSAVGAGAAIGVGGLGPLAGNVLLLGPLFLAATLGVKAFTLASEALTPQVDALKGQFTGLGEAIASGGLRSGLERLTELIGPFAARARAGFGDIGAQLGVSARALGGFLSQVDVLDRVTDLFRGSVPIIAAFTGVLLSGARILLAVLTATMPVAQRAIGVISRLVAGFADWVDEAARAGRLTAFLHRAWTLAERTGEVLWNTLTGLFNMFRIGARYAGQLGDSVERAAVRFRMWTESVGGQQAIANYFRDALPAIREMTLLVGAVIAGFAKLAASQDVAPLLRQIRTELGPALSDLLAGLTGTGGIGPALISMITSVVRALSMIDPAGIVAIINAIGKFAEGITWLMQNVPGAGFAISALATGIFGLMILKPVAGLLGRFGRLWDWMAKAAAATGKLTWGQRMLHKALQPLSGLASRVGAAFTRLGGLGGIIARIGPWFARILPWVGRLAAGIFGLSNPIGWIVTAVSIAAWAIIKYWDQIKTGAIAAWNGIVAAAKWAWGGIVAGARWLAGVLGPIFRVIGTIAKGVWTVIAGAARIAWNVIKFVVQTVVYILAATLLGLLKLGQLIWRGISAAAVWAWQTIIWPAILDVVNRVMAVVRPIVAFFRWAWGGIAAAAQWTWNLIKFAAGVAWAVIRAIFAGVAAWFQATVWNPIRTGAQFLWNAVSFGVGIVVGIVKAAWAGVAGFFITNVWNPIRTAGEAVWNGIRNVASGAAEAIKGIWNSVVATVRGAVNGIINAINSLPDVSLGPLGTFGMPDLPTLWHGGKTPGGPALVGEHGPEALFRNGRLTDILGARGPEVTNLPRGGYVMPNLSTLTAMPGLLRTIPASVASAIAGGTAPGEVAAPPPVPPARVRPDSNRALTTAVRELSVAVRSTRPPINAVGTGAAQVNAAVLAALRQHDREREARGRYRYTAGKG